MQLLVMMFQTVRDVAVGCLRPYYRMYLPHPFQWGYEVYVAYIPKGPCVLAPHYRLCGETENRTHAIPKTYNKTTPTPPKTIVRTCYLYTLCKGINRAPQTAGFGVL